MIVGTGGQPLKREASPMMLGPGLLEGVISSGSTVIDNSSADATISFGTFNFPSYLFRHPTFLRISVRENGVDTDHYEEEGETPLEPPWRVQVGTVLSGDLFNAGSSCWRSAGPNCVNLGNGSRKTFAAGVAGTFVGSYRCEFKLSSSGSENMCPGTTVLYSKDFNMNFTFTG